MIHFTSYSGNRGPWFTGECQDRDWGDFNFNFIFTFIDIKPHLHFISQTMVVFVCIPHTYVTSHITVKYGVRSKIVVIMSIPTYMNNIIS